jgi:hypothetical protein
MAITFYFLNFFDTNEWQSHFENLQRHFHINLYYMHKSQVKVNCIEAHTM